MKAKNTFGFLCCLILAISCSVTKKVKTGESAYELRQYAVAIELLKNEFSQAKSDEQKSRKAYLLGKSYQQVSDINNSLKWFYTADKLEYGVNALKELAFSYKSAEQYDNAMLAFNKLFEQTQLNKYQKEFAVCKEVSTWKNNQQYTIESLDSNTNEFGEYAPTLFEDKFIVFSSDRISSTGDEQYSWTGQDFSDLFIMTKKGSSIYNFEAVFNTRANEGAACFNKDYSEIFFTRCEAITAKDDYCRIYYSNRETGFWTEPRPLLFFDETTNYGQPALLENDSVLVFSVETDVFAHTHDLFYSVRLNEGWSKPEAMPSSINTDGDEVFPTTDRDTLYFSSDHLSGMGGLDIFMTYLKNDNSWARPDNLKSPINSGADDFSFIVDSSLDGNMKSGFFSSNRNGTDDIFSYRKQRLFEEEIVAEEPIEEPIVEIDDEITRSVFVAVKVLEIVRENDDPNGRIVSKVPMPDANLKIESSGITNSIQLDDNALAIHEVQIGKEWKFKAEKVDYLSDSEIIIVDPDEISEDEEIETINIVLELEAIQYDTEIILENIYYDFNKWNIRTDAALVLDSLSQVLIDNPLISIQLGSHTDCRGSIDFNIDLSQKRADSAVNFLTSKGISSRRLSAKGYGESKPIASCSCNSCTEEEHQKNRRTSFKILRRK